MHTEEDPPTRKPETSAHSATTSGRVLFTCPGLLYEGRRPPPPAAGPVDDAKTAAPVTSPARAAETPPAPQAPRLAPEPARRAESTPPVRRKRRGAIAMIALAVAWGGAAFLLWLQSDDEPRSPDPAPAPFSSATSEVSAPAPTPKDEAPPRASQPPASAAKDVHVAEKPAATPPAPAPVARKKAFRPSLPQPEIVGAPRDVDGAQPKSAEEQRPGKARDPGLPAPGFGGVKPAQPAPSPQPPR